MSVLGMRASDEQVRMMVHLLDYIAVDYSMAVENGQIINQAEYQEMKEFASTVGSLGANAPNQVQSDIILLAELIREKAPKEKISSVSGSIRQALINHYHLEIAPKRWPSLENGASLFALHCASCHGAKGLGDGSLAAGLDPAPTNFHATDKANGLSPFQAYNTVRLGVENTGMRAFNELSDDEVWDLAFYVMSLPQQDQSTEPEQVTSEIRAQLSLAMLASKSNQDLAKELNLQDNHQEIIAALRLYPKEVAGGDEADYLAKASSLISASLEAYKAGNQKEARNLALTAYLEGVEPVEVQLRANDAAFVAELESQLGRMRSAIEDEAPVEEVAREAAAGRELIAQARTILAEREFNGWMSFLLSFSIIFREGLEAFLVIITILGIIRALKLPAAAKWVHLGWLSAIASGFVLWLLAEKLFTFSGAQREVMEGVIAIFAVGVLLYVGFWMHSKSEAGKWQAYVRGKIQVLAKKENLLGLAFLSFLVVFREAFESVLFLSALSMEVGESHQLAFGSGVVTAFAVIGVLAVILLKYSRKLPIPLLFKYSAIVISFLAIMLAGKGVHALQEAGMVSISTLPVNFRISLIGLYSSWETILSQLFTLALVVVLWNVGNRVVKKPICETHKEQQEAGTQESRHVGQTRHEPSTT